MAKNKSTVYLAYEDEEITLKHAVQLNSTTNKIGGSPDWPCSDIKVPACPLCGTARPLLVQIYAPLELSQFHRSLFVFACLNPVCSPNSKSWLCVRTQHLDMPTQAELISAVPPPAGAKKKKKSPKFQHKQKISWCTGADDWGAADDVCEDMDTDADDFQQQHEENGNVIGKIDNALVVGTAFGSSLIVSDENEVREDEEEEDDSNSMESDLVNGFGQMEMYAPQNQAEDPNANCAAAVAVDGAILDGGATATFSAEIECSENDVVLVETPKKPERDLIALLKHTPTPAALGPLAKLTDVTLRSFFMAVDLEQRQRSVEENNFSGALSSDHIRELYQEYRRRDETVHSPTEGGAVGGVCVGGVEEQESYEKSQPAHGDLLFHHFVSTIQQNPGQILRYSRDTLPLLIAPLTETVPKCPNCNGETICEVQILSTLIPKLRLQQNSDPAPIEYGNVLVFTCLKSCWDTPDKMRYERIVVQAEK